MGALTMLKAQEGAVQVTTPHAISRDTTRVINPWQQSNGEILISPYISHYSATSFRDTDGNKTDFSNDGKYSNYNPRIYISLPIFSDKLNLIASIPYFTSKYDDATVKNSNADLGDIEIGGRFNITHFGDNYLMGALIAYLPAYSNTEAPFTGYELFGLEGRIILGGTLKFLGDYNNFHKVEVGLRYFFPEDPVQLRFLISEGYRITQRFLVLGELDGMFSFSDNASFFVNNLQSIAEYNMIKASLNLGYDFSPTFSLYAGVFHDIYNRNAAIGKGYQAFAVIKLN
tara:strand:- start:12124 stop:12981 length:858 start_codon:yes stop_codon:yes gene_type:complete